MNCGEVTTERERLREPPPHVTEQGLHAVNELVSQ